MTIDAELTRFQWEQRLFWPVGKSHRLSTSFRRAVGADWCQPKVVRDVIAEEGFDFFRLVRHEGRQIH